MSINCDDVVKRDAVRSNIVINEADSALRSRNEFLTREAEGENCAISCALVINRSWAQSALIARFAQTTSSKHERARPTIDWSPLQLEQLRYGPQYFE